MKYLFRVEINSIGQSVIEGSIITTVPPSDKGFITLEGAQDDHLVIEVVSLSPIAKAGQGAVYKASMANPKGKGIDFMYDGTIQASVPMTKVSEALQFFKRNGWKRRDKTAAA